MKFKDIPKIAKYTEEETLLLDFCEELVKKQKTPNYIDQVNFETSVLNTNVMHSLAYVYSFDLFKKVIDIIENKIGKDKVIKLSQEEQKNNCHTSFLTKVFHSFDKKDIEILNFTVNYFPKEALLKKRLNDLDYSQKKRYETEGIDLSNYETSYVGLYFLYVLPKIYKSQEKIEAIIDMFEEKSLSMEEIKEVLLKDKRFASKWVEPFSFMNIYNQHILPVIERRKINRTMDNSSDNLIKKVKML